MTGRAAVGPAEKIKRNRELISPLSIRRESPWHGAHLSFSVIVDDGTPATLLPAVYKLHRAGRNYATGRRARAFTTGRSPLGFARRANATIHLVRGDGGGGDSRRKRSEDGNGAESGSLSKAGQRRNRSRRGEGIVTASRRDGSPLLAGPGSTVSLSLLRGNLTVVN